MDREYTTQEASEAIWRILERLPHLTVFEMMGDGIVHECAPRPVLSAIRAVKWYADMTLADVALFEAVTEVATHLSHAITAGANQLENVRISTSAKKSTSVTYVRVKKWGKERVRVGPLVAEYLMSFASLQVIDAVDVGVLEWMKPMPSVVACVVRASPLDERMMRALFPKYGGRVPPPLHFSPATACLDSTHVFYGNRWFDDDDPPGFRPDVLLGSIIAAYLLCVTRLFPEWEEEHVVSVLRDLTNVRDGVHSAESTVQYGWCPDLPGCIDNDDEFEYGD